MSKYFTKYLPVEGEIKGGDIFEDLLPNPDRYVVCPSDEDGQRLTKSGHKNVKLFLCSRDIQVGDKPWTPRGTQHNEITVSKQECETLIEAGWFKVIGEISPDALSYIKEGDGFDEENLEGELLFIDNNERMMFIEMGHLNQWQKLVPNPQELKVIIHVKGPCGHFH